MRVVVNFTRNPVSRYRGSKYESSDEWNNLVGLAETSRNVIELARLYQFGKRRGFRDLMNAAMARARQLGFRPSELEADQRGILRRENLTDRAHRYRANAEPPAGPKACLFCGSKTKVMVGHLNGRESDNTPDNLHWTCRSCNTLHANALKRARMGKRTAQFNPSKSGGASNVGEWMQAVGAIRPHKYPDKNAGLTSTMKVSDAVAMIRATPAHKRSEFASKLASSRSGRRGGGSSEVPF
jgi:hypothetical protein